MATSSSEVLTARSGRAALNHHLERLGYKLEQEELDSIYQKFLNLADKKKNIGDEDLHILAGQAQIKERSIKLHNVQVICGSSTIPVATVQINMNGEIITATAEGNGPVDAAYNAVKNIIKRKVRVEEFLVQAITNGSDDMGKVHVQIENKGKIYYGFSGNTDIITASTEAFIDALAKIV
ncbi:alpha-isopropylmalate synthase regulatory domain-containing protein [Bacteroidota bacterium]